MHAPFPVTLHCFGERDDGQWTIICLEFSLAVQDEQFEIARRKMDEQIQSYLRDALGDGVDSPHARALLNRRAPLKYWAMFYLHYFRGSIERLLGRKQVMHDQFPYTSPAPLAPC